MATSRKLNVNESPITVINQNETDYISLTDMTDSFREGSGLPTKTHWNKSGFGKKSTTQILITPNSG